MRSFLSFADFFSKSTFFIKILTVIPSETANSLDPDQARHYAWPDLGPNCLQRLSEDDTSRRGVKREDCNDLWWLGHP